jgi:hypothetical protein
MKRLLPSLLGLLVAANGAVAQKPSGVDASGRFSPYANVLDYGAVADATVRGTVVSGTNNTAAFRAAAATGKFVYVPGAAKGYKLTDVVPLSAGQKIFGDGRVQSVLMMGSDFNPSAMGVVSLGQAEPGASVDGLGFHFGQPDTSVRASLINYPPAVYGSNAARAIITNVRCTAAMTCLWVSGNSGGDQIANIECSEFLYCIKLAGLDTVYVNNVNMFTYGLSTRQASVMGDSTNVGIDLGRVDGLVMSNVFGVEMQNLIYSHDDGSGGVTNGSVTNILADGSGIHVTAGSLNLSGVQGGSAQGGSTQFLRVASGANVTLNGAVIHVQGRTPTNPIVSLAGGVGPTSLQLSGVSFVANSVDQTLISVGGDGNSHFVFTGVNIQHNGGVAYAKPFIAIAAGSGLIDGVYANPVGSGSGVLLRASGVEFMKVANLATNGYTTSITGGSNILASGVALPFSLLPSCSSLHEGTLQAITDSTTTAPGAKITGGGNNRVAGYCDGRNWTVGAK